MNILQTLLGTGILAMRRVRIAVKMSLMGLFPLLPPALLVVQRYRFAQAEHDLASAEIALRARAAGSSATSSTSKPARSRSARVCARRQPDAQAALARTSPAGAFGRRTR